MNFDQPSPAELLPEIPEEIKAFWELLTHMGEKGSNPHEHVDWLTGITKSLSEKDPEFNEIFEKHKSEGVEGMMDALEEYSKNLTEPDKNLEK
jgi:hypothetical protein